MKDSKEKNLEKEYDAPELLVMSAKVSANICGSGTTQDLVEEEGKFEWI